MFHWNSISVSEMCQLTVFWHIFGPECFLQMFHESCKNVLEICQNWYLWQIYDSFLNQAMTVFWHIYYFWYISEAFPNILWQNCDRYMNLTDFWQISDTIQTVFWQIFVNDSFLTDFWQISDRFMNILGPTLSKSTVIISDILCIHLGFDPTEHKIGSNYRFTSYAIILKIGKIPRKSSR